MAEIITFYGQLAGFLLAIFGVIAVIGKSVIAIVNFMKSRFKTPTQPDPDAPTALPASPPRKPLVLYGTAATANPRARLSHALYASA